MPVQSDKKHRAEGTLKVRFPATNGTPPSIQAINVGGTRFHVETSALLRCAWFRGLSEVPGDAVDRDDEGSICVDRCPEIFRDVIVILQGFADTVTPDDATLQQLLCDINFYGVDDALVTGSLRVARDAADERHRMEEGDFKARWPISESSLRLRPGACVFVDGRRMRNSYHVCPMSRRMIVAGRHMVSIRAVETEYVGIGVISSEVAAFDMEFHKIKDCAVFYMSGLLFTNYGSHRRSETRVTWTSGDVITAVLDFGARTLAFWKGGGLAGLVHIGSVRALRFAVVMKEKSQVEIVPTPDDVRTAIASNVPQQAMA